MNWGHKITIVIILFIVTMLGMVFISFKQTNDMLDSNYYEKELKYQTIIDASKRLNTIQSTTLMNQNETFLTIQIPSSLTNGFQSGTAEFLKLDNEKQDKKVELKPDTSGMIQVSKTPFSKGNYKVRIDFESGGTQYYREESVIIN